MDAFGATGPFPKVEDLCAFAQSENVTHVITDHRLREYLFASFMGAFAAATFYAMNIAPVLVTRFATEDMDINIRPYLDRIPRVIDRRRGVSPTIYREALETSGHEVLCGEFARSRRQCRSIVQVTDIVEVQGLRQARFEIRQWRKDVTIGFPVDKLPEFVRQTLAKEMFLIAQVNIEAENASELFVKDFELIPSDESDVI